MEGGPQRAVARVLELLSREVEPSREVDGNIRVKAMLRTA